MRRVVWLELIILSMFLLLLSFACSTGASSDEEEDEEKPCSDSIECPEGETCVNGSCVPGGWVDGDEGNTNVGECNTGDDCGDGYYCEDHFCFPIIENDKPDGDKESSDSDNSSDGDIDGDSSDGDLDPDLPIDGDDDLDPDSELELEPESELELEPEPEPEIPDLPREEICYTFPSSFNYTPEPGIFSSCTLAGTGCPFVTGFIEIPEGGQGDVHMVNLDVRIGAGPDIMDDKEIRITAPGMTEQVIWDQYAETARPIEFNEFWDNTPGPGTWTVTVYDKLITLLSPGTTYAEVCITLVDPAITANIDWDQHVEECSTSSSESFGTCTDPPCYEDKTLTVDDHGITWRYPEVTIDAEIDGYILNPVIKLYPPRYPDGYVTIYEADGQVTELPESITVFELNDVWMKGEWRLKIEYDKTSGSNAWHNFCLNLNEPYPTEEEGDGDLEEELEMAEGDLPEVETVK